MKRDIAFLKEVRAFAAQQKSYYEDQHFIPTLDLFIEDLSTEIDGEFANPNNEESDYIPGQDDGDGPKVAANE
jgi:hypothetical protein